MDAMSDHQQPQQIEDGLMQNTRKFLAIAGALTLLGWAHTAQSSPFDISDWNCEGNCGTAAADGDISLSPFGSSEYGWISTANGVDTEGLGIGNETTGSTITSPLFDANQGDELSFNFNYVTSDGGGFSDYAWALLLDENLEPAAQLFTARTNPGGNTVPGFELPEPDADVALDPSETPIIAGAPEWSPLGNSSGSCFGDGCGYTDWIESVFSFDEDGTFALQFGVVNWNDEAFQSGLAFDGATIAGRDIGDDAPGEIPLPATLALFLTGLAAMVGIRRKHTV
ncbi:NF038132 family protein [Thioalkalivibrio sp. ALJT]|uniref:NF038132 family protein n=1 Tax=Thioalkalivibrio sp. ALJT TaxID=1158146 RepID=UPI001E47C6F0|nr:NF038132 family protein [Thioalkalivibrio sp. ALJT]